MGNEIPDPGKITIGGYKKYKGGSKWAFGQDSTGTFNLNNVELVRISTTDGAEYRSIEYENSYIKSSNSVKVTDGEGVTIKIYDQGTTYYGHGFSFEFHPFG